MFDLNERKYVAISIKHSEYDKCKCPVLWGCKGQTNDDNERSFSGYCNSLEKCELYSLNDFIKQYGNSFIKCDEPVSMCFDYRTKYKEYDTVLVDIEELRQYLKFA